MAVTPASSVSEFFHEVLGEALVKEGFSISEPTEWYLVGLLGDFAHTPIPRGPLGLRLVESGGGDGQRVQTLKEVGDASLYITGFFADSLERGLLAADYYIQIGESAYRELSSRLGGSSVSDVYDELAAGFPRFVDVLAAVRSQVSFAGSDVVQLYREWQRTQSEWVERRLRAMGVIVFDDDDGGTLQ